MLRPTAAATRKKQRDSMGGGMKRRRKKKHILGLLSLTKATRLQQGFTLPRPAMLKRARKFRLRFVLARVAGATLPAGFAQAKAALRALRRILRELRTFDRRERDAIKELMRRDAYDYAERRRQDREYVKEQERMKREELRAVRRSLSTLDRH